MLSKIELGHEDYDVVCPSDYIIERMLKNDLLLPFEREFGKTPDYTGNVAPFIKEKFDEIEDYTWQYSTTLNYDKKPGEEIWFVAEGIDYSYDILLDGEKLLSGEGMFSPVELNITNKARVGALLQITIHPHPKRGGAPRGREEADQSCKPPFC